MNEVLFMNFNQLKYKIMNFMYGRYGLDEAFYGLFVLYLLLAVVNLFFHTWIIQIIELLIVIYALFRIFSKNTASRQKENLIFLKFWNKIKSAFKRIKEMKTHCFHKCPYCKKTLRFPRKKGKHTVVCPCCSGKFKMRVWFK